MALSLSEIRRTLGDLVALPRRFRDLRDLLLLDHTAARQREHSNPLNRRGSKCFSQSDEDGITLEILRRIGLDGPGSYAEFGVGDGTENNTLILAALGWRGFWVGGSELRVTVAPGPGARLTYLRQWVTLDNLVGITRKGLVSTGAAALDVISLDLDGNDIYFVERLLEEGFRPKLFIVEYNGKFPPPVRFQIAYDPAHSWQGDDYFGASLASFQALFARHGYRLVCCNSHSGANAFFVDAAYGERFADVPDDIHELYVAPRYFLYTRHGHPMSLRTVNQVINGP